MKNKFTLLCFLFLSSFAWGQDMHFSQFNENPSLINPALTGANGLRASINDKTQWRSVTTPYKSFGASFEIRSSTFKNRAGGNLANLPPSERVPGKFAIGLSIYKDKSGDGKMSLTQMNLSLATFLKTGEKSSFSLGLQTSYASRVVGNTFLVFPNQYGQFGYDPNLNSGENIASNKFRYLDLATGVMWSYANEERGIIDHRDIKAHIGFSVYHLTSPAQKYFGAKSDPIYMKYVSHGDLFVSIPNSRTAIMPSYLFQLQGKAMEIVAGAMFKYHMNNETRYTGYVKHDSFGFGAYYRVKDALIFSALYEWQEQLAIGLSYDFTVSKFAKAADIQGGMEITLRYTSANGFYNKKGVK